VRLSTADGVVVSPPSTLGTSLELGHVGSESRASFLEAVLDAIQEGVVVVDGMRIVEVNDALCRMLGFTREELIGAELPFPFLPPEQVARIYSLLRRLRETGESELTLTRKDESRFPAELSVGTARVGGDRVGQVLTVRDVSDRHRREARLAQLAATDELTGLLNKRSFRVHLAGELARARRHSRKLSLAILDLDGFKRINDTAGHQGGDLVLAEVAGRLGDLVRTGEHLARVGGDEFGWILPDADVDGARAAVDRARAAIASEPIPGRLGSLTVSAGICTSDGSIDAGELYRRADRALYDAKTTGRDRARVF
jgi:diguanylate cyclase (GGDEF)-like protein/PAS domain S-box-containing protein